MYDSKNYTMNEIRFQLRPFMKTGQGSFVNITAITKYFTGVRVSKADWGSPWRRHYRQQLGAKILVYTDKLNRYFINRQVSKFDSLTV